MVSSDPRDWSEYEAYARRLMAPYQVPGVAVAVAQEGKTSYAGGLGWRDQEKGLPVTEDTIFGVGSITKSFTAVAILQLEEEGRLSLEDPVTRHLPEFRAGRGERGAASARAMTIHHFLTHTSGLPPLVTLFPAMGRSVRDDPSVLDDPSVKDGPLAKLLAEQPPLDTAEQLMAFVAGLDIEILGPPGAMLSYSNDAFALLGTIVERVSGRKYETFVGERILDPLEMRHSTFDLGAVAAYPDVTVLYASRPVKAVEGAEEVYPSPLWWEAPAMVAAGFLRSNVKDLLRYLEVFRCGGTVGGRRILSEASVARMTTPYFQWGPTQFYGYGLNVQANYHGVSIIEHGGGLKGISAQVSWVPEKGLTGAALANLAGVPSNQILLGAFNRLLGLPLDARRLDFPDYACPPLRLPRYAGLYRSEEVEEMKFTVAADGRALVAETEGKVMSGRPVAVDTFMFRHREDDILCRFLTNARGEVYAVFCGLRVIRRVKEEGAHHDPQPS